MDETTMQIEVDSASTAQEVVQQISRAVGIVDPFGFAVFVKLFDKVNRYRIRKLKYITY